VSGVAPLSRSTRAQLVALARSNDRERLARLRRKLKEARAAKRASKKRAREVCAAAKAAVRAFARDERARLKTERERLKRERAELGPEIKRRRAAACDVCVTGKERAELDGAEAVRVARAALADEREQQAIARRWRSSSSKAPKGAALVAERRAESDDEVRANLSGDELRIFERVKARIRPTGRMSRTEAFAQWVHDHSADVARIVEQLAAEDVRALEREERAAARAARRSYGSMRDAELVARVRSDLSDVPF